MDSVLSLQRFQPEPVEGCRASQVSCDSEQSCDSWVSTLRTL